MTVQASPDDLELHARRVGHLTVEVHRVAAQLAPALDRLRAATGDHHAGGEVAPIDVELREVADRLRTLAQLTGGVAAQLRAGDAGGTVALSLRTRDDRRALAGVVGQLLQHRSDPAMPRYDPRRWARTPQGRATLQEAAELLRRRPRGPRPADVDAFERLLTRSSPELADAVVASLDDATLDRLVAAVHGDGWRPGRPLAERHRLWTVIGSRVSLPTFRRIVARTEDLDPDPRLAEDPAQLPRLVADGSVPHDRWYRELVYAERPGRLTWHGDSDDHAVAPSDVTQGLLGNCYLVAAMISAARLRPDRVQRMFTEHPSGTVTVRFPDGVEVTVTPDLPVHPDDPATPAFVGHRTGRHRDAPRGQHELWPKLLEKAVVQRSGGWGEAALGAPGPALTGLLGGRLERRRVVTPEGRRLRSAPGTDARTIRHELAAGRSVMVGTSHESDRTAEARRAQAEAPAARRLHAGHAYVVHALEEDGTATLRDPNRPATALQQVAWDDLLDLTVLVDVNDLDA